MLSPVERTPYACRTCFDVGRVLVGDVEDACPSCIGWGEEQRAASLRADTARVAYKPELSEHDLTHEERAEYAHLKLSHPEAHPLTVLSWIEGRRYNPKDDKDFMRLCERRLAKWRFYREAQEQEIAEAKARRRGENLARGPARNAGSTPPAPSDSPEAAVGSSATSATSAGSRWSPSTTSPL